MKGNILYFAMTLVVFISSLVGALAQGERSLPVSYVNIKTNVLYDFTSTVNLGIEVSLGRRVSLDISASYNPWVFNNGTRCKLWLVQPEFRYWFAGRFDKNFIGVHLHYAEYNIRGIDFFETENSIKQGVLFGAGVSYGYQWRFAKSWALEGELGVGYARLMYDNYDCTSCGSRYTGSDGKNYWGVTKASISLIFFIR